MARKIINGYAVQCDLSGVGHCWKNVQAEDNISDQGVEAWIVEARPASYAEMVGDNGLRYRVIVLCGGPGTPTLCEHLSAKAIARLAEQYDIAALERDWAEGNYGRLYATDTAEQLGRATMQQAIASYEEGYEGHIETHLHGPVEHGLASCYVAPE